MNQDNFAQNISNLRNLFQSNTIGIFLGEKLNQDTAAGGLSLYLSLVEAGKNPQIVSKKEPFVEISNLVGVNKIKKNFSGDSGRVVVSLPYIKGEIGKVSYKEENDRINFYLTAAEGMSISQYETNDINLIWDGATPSVIVAIGVSSPAEFSEMIDSKDNSVKIININNSGESFGDIVLSDPSFSSVSEIVSRIIKDIRLPMNIDIAQNLLDGILYATRNFSSPDSSAYAFEAAGALMQGGAKRVENRNSNRANFTQQQPQQQQNRPRDRFQRVSQNQPNRQNTQNRENNFQANQNKNRQADFPQDEAPQVAKSFDTTPNNVVSEPNTPPANQDVPNDWLMPKVFKGSQNIDDLK